MADALGCSLCAVLVARARLYDRNNTLMERNTMLQEQIDALRSEVRSLKLQMKAA